MKKNLNTRTKLFVRQLSLFLDVFQTKRPVDVSEVMSREVAYTRPLACKMWKLFGSYAGKHGYTTQNGYNCTEYTEKDAIRDVFIGPQVRYC